jgi:hypothetical protein
MNREVLEPVFNKIVKYPVQGLHVAKMCRVWRPRNLI